MRRDTVLRMLRDDLAEIRRYSVASISLFGSVARDDARPGSDVDLLVDFEAPPSLHMFLELKRHLESLLGCPVDVVTPASIPSRKRPRIDAELVRVA